MPSVEATIRWSACGYPLVAGGCQVQALCRLRRKTFGLIIKPSLDAGVLFGALLLTLMIGTLSAACQARLAAGLNIATTMRQE